MWGAYHAAYRFGAYQDLSPHVRGNPSGLQRAAVLRGHIPACAGEPLLKMASLNGSWACPRMCGGTGAAAASSAHAEGLFPHVRENLPHQPMHRAPVGPILACAGEPQPMSVINRKLGVYPRMCGGTNAGRSRRPVGGGLSRMCGGTFRAGPASRPTEGLSPHVRGEPMCCTVA